MFIVYPTVGSGNTFVSLVRGPTPEQVAVPGFRSFSKAAFSRAYCQPVKNHFLN